MLKTNFSPKRAKNPLLKIQRIFSRVPSPVKGRFFQAKCLLAHHNFTYTFRKAEGQRVSLVCGSRNFENFLTKMLRRPAILDIRAKLGYDNNRESVGFPRRATQ